MPPSHIYLCRHAEAEHNVADDYSIPDAPLTALGREQAATLAKDPNATIPRETVHVVLSSALKRTLQTTLIGWRETVDRLGGPKTIIAHPLLQECNALPCDTGSDRAELEKDPEFAGINFDLLTPDWTSKQGVYAADKDSLDARCRSVRQLIRNLPSADDSVSPPSAVLLVAHGDFLRRLTKTPYPWKNTETQLWTFDPNSPIDDPEAPLALVHYTTSGGGYGPSSSDPVFIEHAKKYGLPLPSDAEIAKKD